METLFNALTIISAIVLLIYVFSKLILNSRDDTYKSHSCTYGDCDTCPFPKCGSTKDNERA